MYTELILRPARMADEVIYPDQARRIMAKALNGRPIPPAFFLRDASGKTLQGSIGHIKDGSGFGKSPQVVFDGGKGFLRIYGIGKEGSELLLSQVGTIYSAIASYAGPTLQEMRQGQCTFEYKGYAIPHRIRLLVVNKRPGARAQPIEGNPGAVAAIRRQIVAGLVSQSELVGGSLNLPNDDSIDILEATPYSIPIGQEIFAAAYKNVVFGIPGRLSGPWLAGHLRSRGYGFMRVAINRGGR